MFLAIQHCHLLAVSVNRLPLVLLVNVDCGKIDVFCLFVCFYYADILSFYAITIV